MNEINKYYQEDIKNINSFLNNRPSTIATYCYGIGSLYGKTVYKLIIVTNDLWKYQQKNNKNLEFSIYSNLLYNAGYNYIEYIGIKHDNYLFDYILINNNEFINYLKNWDNITFSSIFQKPVITIKSNHTLNNLIDTNRNNALLLSLIMVHKCETSFFDVMEKLYSIAEPFSNETLTYVDSSYLLLKNIYGNNKYFTLDDSDYLQINKSVLKREISKLPSNILNKIIIRRNYIYSDLVINYLQDKFIKEQSEINDMQEIVNGYIKTFIHNNKNNKIKSLKRISDIK